jgi:L-asparaginase
MRKTVLLLHTGGTLGMVGGRPTALHPGPFAEALRARVPELTELANIELELFSNLDSSEVQPEAWLALARRLHQRLPEVDGAVVTHGTDTLAYTASALSFLLPGLRRPVVLTGSQRPLQEVRSDARLNLVDAVTAALKGPAEVTVCFDSHLFRGNRTVKVKVAEYDAFASPNFPALGTLGVHARFLPGLPPKGRPRLLERLEPRVFLLKVFPGLDPSLPLLLLPHLRGLVVEAYGAGNVPVDARTGRSLLPLFVAARARKVPVVVVSQAQRNAVELGLYEGGAAISAAGAIDGGDLTAPAAVTKLMCGLALHKDSRRLRRYLETSVAGERSAKPATGR